MMDSEKREQGPIIRILGKFVHDLKYEDLPEAIQELAKTRILDALSAAYAGRNLPHSQTALRIVKKSPGKSTLMGSKVKVGLLDAVMANSVMAHSILQEDTAFMGHPGTMMIPVALGVGEQEKASGRETIVAIILGYELMGRISEGIFPLPMTAFRPGPIVGTFGTAATAGRLMKLDIEKFSHGLGYAANLTPAVPNECWWGGAMDPMFESGVCARTGVLSATLARGGATSAPYVLEGKHGYLRCWAGSTEKASLITEGLGKNFVISETIVKPYPACGINQFPIQAALPLAKIGLKAKDISKIVEKTRPGGTSYAGSDCPGPFTSQFKAQMSMQFCASATILGRPVNSVSFFAEHFDDPEVAELAKKVELVCEDGRAKPRLELYTCDGRVFVGEEEKVDEGPRTPSREKMEEKFKTLASEFLGKKKTNEIAEMVMNLENLII